MSENKQYKKLINSIQWRKKRAQKISMNPICEECVKDDKTTLATEVHHIVPVESGRSLAEMERLCFSYMNLQSLCRKCHQNKHLFMNSKSKKSIKESNEREKDRFIDRFLKK